MWTIRLRAPNGTNAVVQRLSPSMPFKEFRALVASAVQFDAATTDVRLLVGHPPAPVEGRDDLPVCSFLANRDTVTVEPVLPPAEHEAAVNGLARGMSRKLQALLAANHDDDNDDGKPTPATETVGQLLTLAAMPAAERNIVDPILTTFRKALRSARAQRSLETLAEQRLAARLAGNFEFIAPHNNTLREVLPAVRVKFRVGPRTFHEEEFLLVPEALLRVVALNIRHDPTACENLRDRNMSLFSPRVFWSVAKAFPDLDVHAALKKLLPHEDWAYLDIRKRMVSEKAVENERQKAVEAATKRPRAQKKNQTASAEATVAATPDEKAREEEFPASSSPTQNDEPPAKKPQL